MTGPLLVTAFEPFGGDEENSSALVLELVLTRLHSPVVSAILPVSYERAPATVRSLAAAHQPRAVVCLGQAAGRVALSFEVLAQNRRDALAPDADGVNGEGALVRDVSTSTLVSTVPLNEMVAAARVAGAPTELSTSAGGYVCNALFFGTLLDQLAPRVGFIHVPLTTTQRANGSAPRLDAGLAAALSEL